MSPRPASIWRSLEARIEEHPDKLLYGFLDRRGRTTAIYTYADLHQRTTEIAGQIGQSGPFPPGSRMLLAYAPGLECICAFWACVRMGLIPVPVPPPTGLVAPSSMERIDRVAADCDAAAVLSDSACSWTAKVQQARAHLWPGGAAPHATRLPWIVTSHAPSGGGGSVSEAHSDIALLQYTSGSTRTPRGVLVSHQNLLENGRAIFDHCPVGVSWLPQFHDMGLIGAYLYVALAGGTTHGFSPVDFLRRPALWLQAMSRFGATTSVAPNFAYGYCLRRDKVTEEELAGVDLGAMRLLMNGAEPVRPDVITSFLERFEPYGLPRESLGAAYGLAEFTLAVSNRGRTVRSFDAALLARDTVSATDPRTAERPSVQLVSCGRPLGKTVVKVVHTVGEPREAGDGRVGEIWVDGPSKCQGYWGQPQRTDEIFHATLEKEDGRTWLRTGDLGFWHEGELYVCGRSKDLIILRGRNHYPHDIESVVEEHPFVRRGCSAAFSTRRDDGEGLVVVMEVRKPRSRPDPRPLAEEISRRAGIAPRVLIYLPPRTISKTTSGKIMRQQTRARWLAGELPVLEQVDLQPPSKMGADGSTSAASTSGERGGSEVRAVFGRYGIDPEDPRPVSALGIDSLAVAELTQDLENLLRAHDAADLADLVDLRSVRYAAVADLVRLLQDICRGVPRGRVRLAAAFARLQEEQRGEELALMRQDASPDPGAGSLRNPARTREPRGDGATLLTGGTGFFGPFLLERLLSQGEGPVYVLVRGESEAEARTRIEARLATLAIPGQGPPTERLVPICGDLSRPRLGLPRPEWDRLAETTDRIYHNGAWVNYTLDYASMRAANVGGTKEVVRLAETGRPKVLNHVSTTFVFGWSTQHVLTEQDRNPGMDLLDFGYSQSKWVAEQVVFHAMARGVPTRVFRPALIAPSVEGGGENFDITIRLLAFMLKHGISTSAGNQVSFSPADLVANNIVAISNLPDTVNQTFHVTRDEYASMKDVTDALGELTGRQFDYHPLGDFVPLVIERCERDDLLFPLLNFLVRSQHNITAMEFKRYDSSGYRRARARAPGAAADPPLDEVVAGIVRFMRRRGILPMEASVAGRGEPE